MKSRLLILCCCLFALASPATNGTDEPIVPNDQQNFHLFLLAGQSNVKRRVDDQAQQPHPRVLSLNKVGEWQLASDPLHFDSLILSDWDSANSLPWTTSATILASRLG